MSARVRTETLGPWAAARGSSRKKRLLQIRARGNVASCFLEATGSAGCEGCSSNETQHERECKGASSWSGQACSMHMNMNDAVGSAIFLTFRSGSLFRGFVL